jgi:hypothetical protein
LPTISIAPEEMQMLLIQPYISVLTKFVFSCPHVIKLQVI